MAENADNTAKTPIETNSDLIAEVQSLVDNLPEAGGGTGVPDYTLLSESEGLAESVSVLEFTGLSGYNDFILTYVAPKTVSSSGIVLYINNRQVSVGLGSYFMHHNTSRNGFIQIRCNLKDSHYWIGGAAQTNNEPYNQDVIANTWGRSLLGEEEVTSIKIALLKAESAIPAGTTYKFYGRRLNA